MRDYIVYDGVNSQKYSAFLANVNQFDAPEREMEIISIPGRNGTVGIDQGSYKNTEIVCNMYVPWNISANLDGFRAFLMKGTSYRRLEDSFHPREFRQARYISGLSAPVTDRKRGAFDLVFDCKPQRFLKEGEKTITLTASSNVIRNPTLYPAKPLIRAYGTGSFSIAGISVTILKADGYTDIDCDTEDAYKGNVNCNNSITLNSGYEFPTLPAGEIPVTMSGITRLEITPGWWTI